VWVFLVGPPGERDFGRVGISGAKKGLHDPASAVELQSITVFGSSDQHNWTTEIAGIFHSPTALPNVPFLISNTEAISVAGGAGFEYLYYRASQNIELDAGPLQDAITALEVILGLSVLNPLAGALGAPIAAIVDGKIGEYLRNALSSAATFQALTPLSMVAAAFPQRFLLDGTKEKLEFPYDDILIPSTMQGAMLDGRGLIATMDPVSKNLVPFVPEAAVTAFGFARPRRISRIGSAFIFGPGTVVFKVTRVRPLSFAPSVVATYSGRANDEAQNPTFKWKLTDNQGNPTDAATLSANEGATVQVTFFSEGVDEDLPLAVKLEVEMDDDLHLIDHNGRPPHAFRLLTGKLGPRPSPPPPPPPRPEPLE